MISHQNHQSSDTFLQSKLELLQSPRSYSLLPQSLCADFHQIFWNHFRKNNNINAARRTIVLKLPCKLKTLPRNFFAKADILTQFQLIPLLYYCQTRSLHLRTFFCYRLLMISIHANFSATSEHEDRLF